jgi:protoheme IX farnesyltransferase
MFCVILPKIKILNYKSYGIAEPKISLGLRLKEYAVLTKLRLSVLVVISATSGYLIGSVFNLQHFLLLIGGGFLVTGCSNGLNQILEREYDKLMKRTQNRPLVKHTLSINEALVLSLIQGVAGLYLLYLINPLSAVLGFFALFTYVVVYTPMKRISPWAVFVGAFPGAIPPMLGYVASTGVFGLTPGILFLVQFMWQFPHFWAIAWVLDDDYRLAGYRLLPSKFGRNPSSSFQILVYTAAMIIASALPWVANISGVWSLIVCMFCGFVFYRYAYTLHLTQDIKDARKLMFVSFVYLPIVQFIYVIDKI